MNAQTLMMIAQGGMRPSGQGRLPPQGGMKRGSYYKCGGDHWARDYPEDLDRPSTPNQPWPRVPRYCLDCEIEHLSRDCPNKPTKRNIETKTSLGVIGVIASSPSSEQEEVISLNAITRAQARQLDPQKSSEEAQKTNSEDQALQKWKRRHQRRFRKGSISSSSGASERREDPKRVIEPERPKNLEGLKLTDTSPRESVVVDPIDDILEAGRIAMESCIALQEYPYGVEEKAQFNY